MTGELGSNILKQIAMRKASFVGGICGGPKRMGVGTFCHDRCVGAAPVFCLSVVTTCLFFACVPIAVPAEASSASLPDTVTSLPYRVGPVTIVIKDIYGRRELEASNGLVRFVKSSMNTLHPSTRRSVIERELLFRTGDPLRPARLAETERNLRSLGYLTNVEVVPVDTLPDGTVPVEVRVQETWSLQAEFSYSRSSGAQQWNLHVSDENFLGRGLNVEMGVGENEDRSFRMVGYHDRRLWGSPWRLDLGLVDQSDGDRKEILLARPFYRQDDPLGVTLAAYDRRSTRRFYLPDAGSLCDGTPTGRLYARLPSRDRAVRGEWLVRLSPVERGRIWRVGLGLWWRERSFRLEDEITLSSGRTLQADSVLAYLDPALGRESGRLVVPLLIVSTSGRNWGQERYIGQYGSVEDLPLDPSLRLELGPALSALGSDRERLLVNLHAQDWSRVAGGYAMIALTGRLSAGSTRNRSADGDLLLAWFGRPGKDDIVRLTAEGAAADHLLGADAFVLGLTRGLRTLEYDGRAGDRLWRWNAEYARLLPGELLGFYRVGLAAFLAAGDAWWRGGRHAAGGPRHEAGVGLRFGPTRSARAAVARLDLTWSLDGGAPVVTAATGGWF